MLHATRGRIKVLAFVVIASSAMVAGVLAQTPAAADRTLVIGGDVPKPITLSTTDFRQLPRVTVVRREGAGEAKYEGVLVAELLKRAGAPLGQGMGRQMVASYLLASAKDGYQAIYAMGEVDPVFADSEIMVADTMNGAPLPEGQGPFRIVAPHDKGAGRSVRELRRLELVRVQK